MVTRFLFAMEHDTPEALQRYLLQHPKADRSNHSVKKRAPKRTKSEPDPAPAKSKSRTELAGIFKPSTVDVEASVKLHKAEFDKIDSAAAKETESFKSTKVLIDHGDEFPEIEPADLMTNAFAKFSLGEKTIHVAGHKVGERFEKSLSKSEKKIHEQYLHNWHTSATSWDREGLDKPEDYDHKSQELQGLLSSLGVSGHAAPADGVADTISKGGLTKARAKATENTKLLNYVKKMYDYQQAYFRNAGLKEVTLYRGVVGADVDGAADGSKIKVQSREVSSFTADPNIAKRFGRVIEFKVPVGRVFASSLVRPAIGSETAEHSSNEAEFLIMGASDLEGQTIGKPIDRKTASAAVIEIPITDENADWLKYVRKKSGSQAMRVARRFKRLANELVARKARPAPSCSRSVTST